MILIKSAPLFLFFLLEPEEEQETSSVTDEDNSLSELNDLFNYLNNDDSFNN